MTQVAGRVHQRRIHRADRRLWTERRLGADDTLKRPIWRSVVRDRRTAWRATSGRLSSMVHVFWRLHDRIAIPRDFDAQFVDATGHGRLSEDYSEMSNSANDEVPSERNQSAGYSVSDPTTEVRHWLR